MTGIELLPLPPLHIAPSVEPVDYPNVAQALMDYARANVDHHTAANDAEIEALRAEVAAWEGLHASEVQVRQRWQARAERLAEALRMMVENADDLVAYRHDEDDIGDRPCCQVASYEPHADHCPTHIARAALRDHAQGGKNG